MFKALLIALALVLVMPGIVAAQDDPIVVLPPEPVGTVANPVPYGTSLTMESLTVTVELVIVGPDKITARLSLSNERPVTSLSVRADAFELIGRYPSASQCETGSATFEYLLEQTEAIQVGAQEQVDIAVSCPVDPKQANADLAPELTSLVTFTYTSEHGVYTFAWAE